MIVTHEQLLDGLLLYIEKEVFPKMSGVKQWVFGALLVAAQQKSENVLKKFNENEGLMKFIESLDLKDTEQEGIKVDVLFDSLTLSMRKYLQGKMKIETPLGNFIFLESDLPILKKYITT